MDDHTRAVVEAVAAYLERPGRRDQPMTAEALDCARSSAAAKTGHLTETEIEAAVDQANQMLPAVTPNITRGGYAQALRSAGGPA